MHKILSVFTKILGVFKSGSFRVAAFALLKREATKLALKKLAKGILKGSFGNWLITFAVENLMEEFVFPLIKKAFNVMGYHFDKIEGRILIKKLKDAEKKGDQNEYDDIVIDIWNS